MSKRFQHMLILLCAVLPTIIVGGIWLLAGHGAGDEEKANADSKSRHRFQDLAEQSGITFQMNFLPQEQGEKFKGNLYDHGCGLALADFDGDGFDDIYFLNQLGRNALYRNKGDGTFVDVTSAAGVGLGDRVCVAAAWGDYDNDGHPDLFVTSTRGGNVLFKNLGNGKFKDVTRAAGVSHVGHSQTALFFDYDNDGYLDLLVTNSAQWTMKNIDPLAKYYPGTNDFWELGPCVKEYNVVYRNNHDGTFSDVTDKAGLKGQGWAGDAAILDYDEDGFMDVLMTNMFGRSQLFRNNGNGTFTEVSAATLKRTSWGAAGCKTFDFNNDGKLDLYIVDMHSDMWLPGPLATPDKAAMIDETAKYEGANGMAGQFNDFERKFAEVFHIRYAEVVFGNTFFKNLGQGKFEEISAKAGLETFWPWGIANGDFDNDGYEDVFLASGMGYPYFYWPNYLLMNNGDETFTNRAHELGIEPPARGQYFDAAWGGRHVARSSRCAAVADFDNDGRLEIATNNFNDRPYYFKNNFPRKDYLALRLRGTVSNRDAIGAVVRLHAGKQILTRQVQPAGGYLSQSSKTLHFGLGDHDRVDRLEIRWPSGRTQVLPTLTLNQRHDITEPKN